MSPAAEADFNVFWRLIKNFIYFGILQYKTIDIQYRKMGKQLVVKFKLDVYNKQIMQKNETIYTVLQIISFPHS